MTKSRYYRIPILIGLSWAFAATVIRSLRWPNDWAEAHWLVSYEFGFIKRALPGTLIAPLTGMEGLDGREDTVIRIVSIVFFVLFCAGMLWISGRIIKRSHFRLSSILVTLAFATSPYVVMSAHLVGYFDNLIILVSLLSCLVLLRENVWGAALILAIGILIHETIIVVGFPLVLWLALVQHLRRHEAARLDELIVGFLGRYRVLYFVPLFVFACVVINQNAFLDTARVKYQIVSHLSEYDFIERGTDELVQTAFVNSFIGYLKRQSSQFLYRITRTGHIIRIGLPLLVLLGYAWYRLRKAIFGRWLFFGLMVITFLPLGLHAVAWDISRIWTYPLVVAMLGVWGISEVYPVDPDPNPEPRFFRRTALVVIVAQMFLMTPLMDGMQERYSDEDRILLYAPSVILLAMFA